ncbi:PspC domain-containing protein [Streptomyces sp. MST-110588]|uniref:PspC domain-containing protein n=1 Tax=Streptomyces sp. MST-110588 TaxID=2833628 RepID=UPI001F5D7F31|nr:PspC domain-containing protein [Streptomyces sp. MST-110588]UNO40340.1 PspC domain-containing protein [Streptomyces sp. MST-110588]
MTDAPSSRPGGRTSTAEAAAPADADGTTGTTAGAPSGATGDGGSSAAPSRTSLRRSRRHRVISGVCGGLGRHWDLDPVIFRIVLAVLAVCGGVGLIAYGFAWLLIPLEGEEENEGRRLLSGRVEGPALTALLCALVGCGLFLSMLGNGGVLGFTAMLSLAVAGSAYWSRQRRKAEAGGADAVDPATAQVVADAPPETTAPPAPYTPSWWRAPLTKDGAAGPDYLWGPADAALNVSYEPGPASPHAPHGLRGPGIRHTAGWTGQGAPAAQAARRKTSRAGRPIGGWTFLLALIVGTAATAGAAEDHPLAASLQVGLSCALIVFGLGLVLSAWLGRTGGGTVFMVVLTAALLAGATVLPQDLTLDWKDRTWAPTSAADVRQAYQLGSGHGVLDFSDLKLKDGQTVRTRASVGAGQLEVAVPPGVTTRLHIEVGIGDVRLPGEAANDVDISPGQKQDVTLPAEGLKSGEKPHGTLDLDLHAGAGQVEVRHAYPATNPPTSSPTPSTAPSATPTPASTARQGGRS